MSDEKLFKIRRFKNSDAQNISEIIIRCLKEINSKDYPSEIINGMIVHFTPERVSELAQERKMYVATYKGEVVGTVSRDGNKVFTMFVNPDFSAQGIGSKLMDYIEQLAASEKYEYMETGASITAHDFYRKRGYKDIRETMTEIAGLNYILQKPLKNSKVHS